MSSVIWSSKLALPAARAFFASNTVSAGSRRNCTSSRPAQLLGYGLGVLAAVEPFDLLARHVRNAAFFVQRFDGPRPPRAGDLREVAELLRGGLHSFVAAFNREHDVALGVDKHSRFILVVGRTEDQQRLPVGRMPDRNFAAGHSEFQRHAHIAFQVDRGRGQFRFDRLPRAAELERAVEDFALIAVAPMHGSLSAVGQRADEPRAAAAEEAVVKVRSQVAEAGIEVIAYEVEPQAAVAEGQIARSAAGSWKSR